MRSILNQITAAAACVGRLAQHPLGRLALAVIVMVVGAFYGRHDVVAGAFMAGVLTESMHAGEFLLSEAEGTRSRDTVTVTVPANTTLAAGYVLGKIAASGKYAPYKNGAADGTEVAKAILYAKQVNDAGAAVDVKAVIIDADAEVLTAALTWFDEVNDKVAGLADLLAVGIKAR